MNIHWFRSFSYSRPSLQTLNRAKRELYDNNEVIIQPNQRYLNSVEKLLYISRVIDDMEAVESSKNANFESSNVKKHQRARRDVSSRVDNDIDVRIF